MRIWVSNLENSADRRTAGDVLQLYVTTELTRVRQRPPLSESQPKKTPDKASKKTDMALQRISERDWITGAGAVLREKQQDFANKRIARSKFKNIF